LGQGDGLQQAGAAGDRIDAGLVHRALDGDPLAGELLDEDADLRRLQVFLAQAGGDLLLQLLDGAAAGADGADQRQRDHAAGVDPHLAVEVVQLEDGDLQQVQGADAVVGDADVGALVGGGVGGGQFAGGGDGPGGAGTHGSRGAGAAGGQQP